MALRETITQTKREPIRDAKHVMTFGKYKDFSINEITEVDPKYLLWLHDNTDFELHADLYDEITGSVSDWNKERLNHEFRHFKD